MLAAFVRLVDNFETLNADERKQLADKFQLSPEEGYIQIMQKLMEKEADIDDCHTELVFYWDNYITGT